MPSLKQIFLLQTSPPAPTLSVVGENVILSHKATGVRIPRYYTRNISLACVKITDGNFTYIYALGLRCFHDRISNFQYERNFVEALTSGAGESPWWLLCHFHSCWKRVVIARCGYDVLISSGISNASFSRCMLCQKLL